jgi:hypothetical protein
MMKKGARHAVPFFTLSYVGACAWWEITQSGKIKFRKGAKEQSSTGSSNDDWRQSFIRKPVTFEDAIVSQEPQFLHPRLSNEHAIEWIPMNRR